MSSGIYVDPEDWSAERTKSVPTLEPGESTTISWSVTAVTGGRAAVYVVVLPEDPGRAESRPSSPAIDVRIAETKDLNSDGVLPLALGVPALLGLRRSPCAAAAAAEQRLPTLRRITRSTPRTLSRRCAFALSRPRPPLTMSRSPFRDTSM